METGANSVLVKMENYTSPEYMKFYEVVSEAVVAFEATGRGESRNTFLDPFFMTLTCLEHGGT